MSKVASPNVGSPHSLTRWTLRDLAVFFQLAICLSIFSPPSLAREFSLPPPGTDLVGEEEIWIASHEDTFVDIGLQRSYGYIELRLANPDVDAWLPGAGTAILLPGRRIIPDGPRRGIVINLAEKRMYVFPQQGESVRVLPITIGREGAKTPLGTTTITQKIRDPSWTVPQSLIKELAAEGRTMQRVVPPGPDNPLGDRALLLGWPGILIHGTDNPYAIGLRASLGCIRLAPETMRSLFDLVPRGTPVRVEHMAVKAGWQQDALYLETHRPLPEYGSEADIQAELIAALRSALARKPGNSVVLPMDQVLAIALRFEGQPVRLWPNDNESDDKQGVVVGTNLQR